MRLSRALRPAWSLAAFGLALSLLTLPVVARAADDDDDNNDNGRQGTVRIYGGDTQGGYLGVQVQDVTRALQRARNLPTDEGALVSRVEDDSPADQSGIRRGDVITDVNRQKIENSADLIRVVGGLNPGDRARVTLWRSGSVRTVNVQVGERPKGMTGMPMLQHPMMPPDAPMGPDMNRDVQRQIRELQAQVQELRQEIQSLRQEIRGHDNDNRDNDRSRARDNQNDD